MSPQDAVDPAGAPADAEGPPPSLVFGIVAIALFMGSVDSSIVATALPAIHKSLHASINWVGWTITIYSLGNVIVLPIAGKFSDQFGRRRIFLIGVAVFTVSSLLCGFATNIYLLIACRALQAVGGGALQPSAAGVIADHFGRNRDRALGMFSTIASSGQITGPVFGGLLVGYLSWRWIFFVNVPLGVVLLVLIARFIPESRPLVGKRTDVRGLLLLAMFVLAANFGITSLGDRRTTVVDPSFLAPALGAIGLLWLFIRHSKRDDAPFIPLRFLRDKGFAAMNVQNLLYGAMGFGIASLVPLYAEERYHLVALSAGTLLTARGVGSIAVGALTAFLLRRVGYRRPMVLGFVLVALGTLVMSVAPRWGISPYAWLSVAAAIAGLGNGTATPASRNALMQLATEDIASLTGLRQMFSYMGIIFSVSIVTAVLNRSPDPGTTQAHLYWVVAGILVLVMVPLVRRVPEHKGTW